MEEELLYDEFGNYIGPEGGEDEDDGVIADETTTRTAPQSHYNNPDIMIADDDDDDDYNAGRSPGDENMEDDENDDDLTSRAVILHEDKKYYADAEDVYGPSVQVLVEDEDAQKLSEPIVAPVKKPVIAITDARAPVSVYAPEFLAGICERPELIRNVALVGAIHHGKTCFADVLVSATHDRASSCSKLGSRYTDTRLDEQELKVSVKDSALTLALQTSSGKHYAISVVDTPGHIGFCGEVTAALRLVDGVAVVIDVVEGVTMVTERILCECVREGLPIIIILNKMDRLITELRIPPTDTYHKIRDILETVNTILECAPIPMGVRQKQPKPDSNGRKPLPRISPARGNVVFASATQGWCFTLDTVAQTYLDFNKSDKVAHGKVPHLVMPMDKSGNEFPSSVRTARAFSTKMDSRQLAQRFWGDIYFDHETHKFVASPPAGQKPVRSFVEFVLEPLYKIFSTIVGEGETEVRALCRELCVPIRAPELRLSADEMLKIVLGRFFGSTNAFVDSIVRYLPSPVSGARAKTVLNYTGALDSGYAKALESCNTDGPLLIHVTKLLAEPEDATKFNALGRVMCGTVTKGQKLYVMGESFCDDDNEEVSLAVVGGLYLPVGRHRISVDRASAGTLVLLEGVDESIMRTATLCDAEDFDRHSRSGDIRERAHIFRPLAFSASSVSKIAIEPLHPSELPKMLEGLRKISKSYLLVEPRKEESGEHTLVGTGELHLDCVMRDLRLLYTGIEIKVSDPFVSFSETVLETSSAPCFATTPNHRNKITMIAEPLEPELAADIEKNAVSVPEADNTCDEGLSYSRSCANTRRQAALFLSRKYGWDELAATSLWAFGPGTQGPNALLDDTLPPDVDKQLLGRVRKNIVQGFRWGVREGPLCEEPVRGVKFRLINAQLAPEEQYRSGVQLIPTARRVCYSAMLTAIPRLLEPILKAEIVCPQSCASVIQSIVVRRRGQIIGERRMAGTPLLSVLVYIPAVETFGFETEIRTHTLGQAFCQQVFDRWEVAPGNPLDTTIVLRPLEPAPQEHLAREFLVKTRRRKGLSEDVVVEKFFDEEFRALHGGDALGSGGLL